jgi:hypothetical protein
MQSLFAKRSGAIMALRASQQQMTSTPAFFFAGDTMKDKSKGDEKNFFTKEDQKVLQALIKKMQNQTKVLEKDEDKHAEALKKVLKDHKINADDHKEFVDALLEWRKKI